MRDVTAIFTIIAKNYLPYARVLMRSVAEHHPDWRRFVILVDQIDGYFDPQDEDFEIVFSRDLPIPRSNWFHFKYTILELSTAVKPYIFEYLFKHYPFERIIYLDPDIKIYSPLSRITEALESANIVLTPHLTGSLEDDRRPAEIDILRSGAYNLGFIGIARSGETEAFLAWWQQKLYDHCVVDLPRGLFVDQRWIDLAPGMFPGVAILRDPTLNVAYWNLSHRHISRSEHGYEIAGFPLGFFHFSGFDANQPHRLSRHQNRHKIEDLPAATQQLLLAYREELLAAGYAACKKWPYTFARFRNGVDIPDVGRPVHNEAPELLDAIDDPFSDEGFAAFLEIWNGPVQDEMGAPPGISRLAYRIYRTRTDVQSAMPDIFGGNYKRFLEWMLVRGKVEHGLGEVFLTTIADAMRTCKDHREATAWPVTAAQNAFTNEMIGESAASANGKANGNARLRLTRLAAAIYQARPELQRYFPDPCGRDSARFLVWLLTYGREEHNLSPHNIAPMKEQWRSVLNALPSAPARLRYELTLRGMAASVFVRRALNRLPLFWAKFWPARKPPAFHSESLPKPRAPISEHPKEFGVNLVGYFHSETGIGQSARGAYAALRAAGVPASVYCVNDPGSSSKRDQSVGSLSNGSLSKDSMSGDFPYSVNLFHVNADQTDVVRRSLDPAAYSNRHNIGYWHWELEEFPDRWIGALAPYQEIWTASNFCRTAVSRKAGIPVFCIPHAIAPEVPSGMDRQYFGLAPDRFVFLYAFDALSVMERKNPIAAIRAFEKAFVSNSQYQLVLKVNHADAVPDHMEKLRRACSSSAIRIMDSTLTRGEMYALTQCVDCAVSLHRSEGFGLFIAEAMYFGKPVIVTNYSGNVDFTLRDNSLLVDYKLVPVGPNCKPYDAGSVWAEPDVEEAASHMRSIATNADLRARLSAAGSDFVRRFLSTEAVGQRIRQRLRSESDALRPADARHPAVRAAVAGNVRTNVV